METNTNALLVMDMQIGLLGRLPQQGIAIVKKVAEAISAAREKHIPVIFVRVGFQKGLPEVNPRNSVFSAYKERLSDASLEMFMQLHPALGSNEDDIIINKKRVSAFSGSDLEMILRAKDITHLVLTGIATSGVVLSTVREAFDKDYQLTVLSDGCADSDEETHRFLLEKVLPKQAGIMTIADWKMKG